MSLTILSIIVQSLFTSPAIADEYYVSSSVGNDTNLGNETNPWQSIQHAANSVKPGDVVIVAPGDYPESISITRSGTADDPITFKSQAKHGAVLQGGIPLNNLRACTSSLDCQSSPHWGNIYRGTVVEENISLRGENTILTENGIALQMSLEQENSSTSRLYLQKEGMKPLTDTRNDGSCNKIYDPSINKPDDYYLGSSVWFWTKNNGNVIRSGEITSWDNTEKSFTFSPPLSNNRCLQIQTDQNLSDAYVIRNHVDFIKQKGDYVIGKLESGDTRTVFVWPEDSGNLDTLKIASNSTAMRIRASNITIEGFQFHNYGIRNSGGTIDVRSSSNVSLLNNKILVSGGSGAYFGNSSSNANFLYNIINEAFGFGVIMGDTTRGKVIGNSIRNTNRTSMYFAGSKTEYIIAAGNYIGRAGQHGNGSAVYQGAGNILYVDNRFIGTHSSITTNSSTHDVYIFRNIFQTRGYGAIAMWGGGLAGDILIANNIFIKVPGADISNMIYTGESPDLQSHVWINNYISGSCDFDKPIVRSHNGWKDDETCWRQRPKYNWSLLTGEWEESDLNTLFVSLDNYDFRPKTNSKLSSSGISAYQYLPISKFPEFKFGSNCSSWDIGAYTCDEGPEIGSDPLVHYIPRTSNEDVTAPIAPINVRLH